MRYAKKNDNFANRLKLAMSIRGLKQSDLVQKSHISKQKISQYVNGQFEPRQTALYTIANALEVSIPWLMGYDVPMEQTKAESTTTFTKEEKEILDLVSGLDPADKENLKNYIRNVLLLSSKYEEKEKNA